MTSITVTQQTNRLEVSLGEPTTLTITQLTPHVEIAAPGPQGRPGSTVTSGLINAPELVAGVLTATVSSNWGVDVDGPYYDPAGAVPAEAAIASLDADGVLVLTDLDPSGTPSLFINVKHYGAKGNGTTDDTSAVQDAIDAANARGGGPVYFPPGTYLASTTLTLYSRVRLVGGGRESTTIKLASAANTDLIKTSSFGTLTGGGTSGGVTQCAIIDLILDGNGAAQTSGTGACFKHYGSMLIMERVIVRNARGDGLFSEWSSSAVTTDGCEGVISEVSVHHNGGNGITWSGPHDTHWVNVMSFQNSGIGFHIKAGAAIHTAVACHSWGLPQTYAWLVESRAHLTSCQGEGASIAQLKITTNNCAVLGGSWFAGDGSVQSTTKGIALGDSTHAGISGTRLNTEIVNCEGGSLDLTYSGGSGEVQCTVYQDGSNPAIVGTVPNNEQAIVRVTGARSGDSICYMPSNGLQIRGASVAAFLVVGSVQVFQINGSSKQVLLPNATDLITYKDNYTTAVARIYGATGGVRPGTTAGLGGTQFSGSGVPTIAGVAGDFYFRTDTPATASQRIYVCTVTGSAGSATWAGIV